MQPVDDSWPTNRWHTNWWTLIQMVKSKLLGLGYQFPYDLDSPFPSCLQCIQFFHNVIQFADVLKTGFLSLYLDTDSSLQPTLSIWVSLAKCHTLGTVSHCLTSHHLLTHQGIYLFKWKHPFTLIYLSVPPTRMWVSQGKRDCFLIYSLM